MSVLQQLYFSCSQICVSQCTWSNLIYNSALTKSSLSLRMQTKARTSLNKGLDCPFKMHSRHSDQNLHRAHFFIQCSYVCKASSCGQRRLWLGGAGSVDSSLGAHVRMFVVSRCSSMELFSTILIHHNNINKVAHTTTLRKHAYSVIWRILTPKIKTLRYKILIFFISSL